jgi:hypothetical protein
MLIVANNLAQYMDSDLPQHAQTEFEVIMAQREPSPFQIEGIASKLHDMTRPKKAQEILDIRDRFINNALFRRRTQVIVAEIENMLDGLTPNHNKEDKC